MELTLHVNDKLKIYSKSFIANYHYQVVNLLYQPIMGIEATNLYMLLWNLFNIEKQELIISHRQLITFFNWDINKLLIYRNKLEAIGLLNIYYNVKEGYYIYELKQPLNAKQFFLDSNLNVHLLYIVGENMYEYLERKFVIKKLDESYVNITKNFDDLYSILPDTNEFYDKQYVVSTVNNFVTPIKYDFDFELFEVLLNKSFVSMDMLTDCVKEQVLKEAALYNFDAQMMSKIVLESVKADKIDLDMLHEVARRYYKKLGIKVKRSEIKPSMSEVEFNKAEGLNLNAKQKVLKSYKTKTPSEWLRILQNNTEVPSSFLEVVRVLFDDYKLPSEVINVLIEFIRIRNDGRLPLEYAKTIASSWAFKKIQTAEEAMKVVEKIQEKEKEYTKRGEVAPTYRYKKPKRVETEPVWMKEHQKYSDKKNSKQTEASVDVDELKKLLESFK